MKRIELKNIIKESITDYLSALNETTEEITPMQQYLMDYESEISNSPEQYFDDIKKLNSINDVIGYYGGKRQWTADKDLKQELFNLIKILKSKFPISEGLIDETPITEEVTELESNISKDGKIYLVRKPNKDTAEGGIVEEKSISELIGADYIGAFTSKEKAAAFGKKALKQRDAELKENVKKGQAKVGDLETQIATLKVDMQKLIDNPDTRSELGSYTARLEKFEALLGKLKSALDSNSPKKEKKEDKDEE